MQANEQSGEEAKPAKNHFFHNYASDEKNLSTNEPKDGNVVRFVRVMGRSSRQHEGSSCHGQDDERFSSALGGRDLCTKEFSGTDYEKGDVGKLRLNGLEFHAAQQQPHIQDRSAGACLHRPRSEEHTSELQSLTNLVCRLLLEKKNIR